MDYLQIYNDKLSSNTLPSNYTGIWDEDRYKFIMEIGRGAYAKLTPEQYAYFNSYIGEQFGFPFDGTERWATETPTIYYDKDEEGNITGEWTYLPLTKEMIAGYYYPDNVNIELVYTLPIEENE